MPWVWVALKTSSLMGAPRWDRHPWDAAVQKEGERWGRNGWGWGQGWELKAPLIAEALETTTTCAWPIIIVGWPCPEEWQYSTGIIKPWRCAHYIWISVWKGIKYVFLFPNTAPEAKISPLLIYCHIKCILSEARPSATSIWNLCLVYGKNMQSRIRNHHQ